MDPYNRFPPSSMGPDGGPPLLEATQYGVDQFGNVFPTYTKEIVHNFHDVFSGHDWDNYYGPTLPIQPHPADTSTATNSGFSTFQAQPANTLTNADCSTLQAQRTNNVRNVGFLTLQAPPATHTVSNPGFSTLYAQPANTGSNRLGFSTLQAQPANTVSNRLGFSTLQAQPVNTVTHPGFLALQAQPVNTMTHPGFSTLQAQPASTVTHTSFSALQAQPAHMAINSAFSTLSISQDPAPGAHLTDNVGASVLPANQQQAQDDAVVIMPVPSMVPHFCQSSKYFCLSIISLNNPTF